MLESELFELLEHPADAAYTVTDAGEICSWNGAAERLFGYPAGEVLRRNVDEVFEARDGLGTAALAGGSDAAIRHWGGTRGGTANFDLEVRLRTGDRMWVNVSTIIFDNQRTGRRLFVRVMHDIGHRRRKEELLHRMEEAVRQIVSLTDDASQQTPVEPLSAQTLRNHLHHINRKLRTHNRLEAMTHAQRRGLI